MPIKKDPWGQQISEIKTDLKNRLKNDGHFEPINMFKKSDLQSLIDIPHTEHIAFLRLPIPSDPDNNEMMIALAADKEGKPVSGPSIAYAWSEHNCPPDCDEELIENFKIRE